MQKMESKMKTISAKIDDELSIKIDNEAYKLGFKGRSEYLRYCVNYAMDSNILLSKLSKNYNIQIEKYIAQQVKLAEAIKMLHEDNVDIKKSILHISELLSSLGESDEGNNNNIPSPTTHNPNRMRP